MDFLSQSLFWPRWELSFLAEASLWVQRLAITVDSLRNENLHCHWIWIIIISIHKPTFTTIWARYPASFLSMKTCHNKTLGQTVKNTPSSLKESLDVGGAFGERGVVGLCATAKRSRGYHELRHPGRRLVGKVGFWRDFKDKGYQSIGFLNVLQPWDFAVYRCFRGPGFVTRTLNVFGSPSPQIQKTYIRHIRQVKSREIIHVGVKKGMDSNVIRVEKSISDIVKMELSYVTNLRVRTTVPY